MHLKTYAQRKLVGDKTFGSTTPFGIFIVQSDFQTDAPGQKQHRAGF